MNVFSKIALFAATTAAPFMYNKIKKSWNAYWKGASYVSVYDSGNGSYFLASIKTPTLSKLKHAVSTVDKNNNYVTSFPAQSLESGIVVPSEELTEELMNTKTLRVMVNMKVGDTNGGVSRVEEKVFIYKDEKISILSVVYNLVKLSKKS